MAPSTSSGLAKLNALNDGLKKTLSALAELDKFINKGVELKLNDSFNAQTTELKKLLNTGLDGKKVGLELGKQLTSTLKKGLESIELKTKVDSEKFNLEFGRLADEAAKLLTQLNSIVGLQLDNSTFLFVHQLRNAQAALMKFEDFLEGFSFNTDNINIETSSEETALGDFSQRLNLAAQEIDQFLTRVQNADPPDFTKLQQRLDEIRLPDFNKILSLDGASSADFNSVATDLLNFGNTLGQSNTELLAEFSDLRDKIFQLSQATKDSANDIDALDLLAARIVSLSKELTDFINSLKSVEPRDILDAAGQQLENEVKRLRKKLKTVVDSIDEIKVDDVEIDTDGIRRVLDTVRRNLEGLENLKIKSAVANLNENIVSIDISVKELKNLTDSLVNSADNLNVNENKLKDTVLVLFTGLKTVAEGLNTAAPFFETINLISDNAGRIGPLFKALDSSLPGLVTGIEQITQLIPLNVKGLQLLSQAATEANQRFSSVDALDTEPLDKLFICANNAAEALCKASDKIIEFQANLGAMATAQQGTQEDLIAQLKDEIAQREKALRAEIAQAQKEARSAAAQRSTPPDSPAPQVDPTLSKQAAEIEEQLVDVVEAKTNQVNQQLAREQAEEIRPELQAQLAKQQKAIQDALITRVIRSLSGNALVNIAGINVDPSQRIDDFPEIQQFARDTRRINNNINPNPGGDLNRGQARRQSDAIGKVENELITFLTQAEDGFERLTRFLAQTVDPLIRTQGGSNDQNINTDRARGVFTDKAIEKIKPGLSDTETIDPSVFIDDTFLEDKLKPLIKETRAEINALTSEINEFSGSLLKGDADLLDFERNSIKIQELRNQINELLVLVEQVNSSETVSAKAKASFNRGTKSFATQKSNFISTTFENLLPLASGQLISDDELQKIVDDFERISDTAQRQIEDSEDIGDKYILGILSGIDRSFPRLLEQATGKTEELLLDLKARFETKTIELKAKESGENISQGLAKGIEAEKQKALAAAREIIEDVIGAAEDEAEIASPSKKVRRRVGKPIGQGITEGIKDELPNVLAFLGRAMDTLLGDGLTKKAVNALSSTDFPQLTKMLAEKMFGDTLTEKLIKKGSEAVKKAASKIGSDGSTTIQPSSPSQPTTIQSGSQGQQTVIQENQQLEKTLLALNKQVTKLEGNKEKLKGTLQTTAQTLNQAAGKVSKFAKENQELNQTLRRTKVELKLLRRNFKRGFDLGAERKNVRALVRELQRLKQNIVDQNPILSIFGDTFRDIFFGGLAVIGVTQLGDAIIEFGRSVAGVTIEVDRLSKALEFVTGSNLGRVFAEDTAKRLNLSLKDTLQNFQQLAAATRNTRLEGARTEELFEAISKSSIVLGRSNEQQAGIIRQLGQSLNKGKLLAEEINTLAENGLNIRAALAQSLGKTASETAKLIEDGRIGLDEIFNAVKFLGEEAESGLNSALKTTNALLNRARNLWVDTLLEVGEKLKPIINILLARAIDILNGLLAAIKNLGPTFKAVFNILRGIFTPLELTVRGLIEVLKFIAPAFDLILVKSGLLKGAFTALTLVIAAQLTVSLLALAKTVIPLVVTAMGAVIAKLSIIAAHPVGLALITIGLAAAALTNDLGNLSTGLKVLSSILTVVFAAFAKMAIAAAVTNPALGAILVGITAVTAGLIQFSIWAKDATNAILGIDQAVVDFNSSEETEKRNAKLNRSFQSLAKGVALTDKEFKEVVDILEKEIEMSKRAGTQNNGLEQSNRKLISSIKERQAEAKLFTERQEELGKAIDNTTEAFERQTAALNNRKESNVADLAEQLEADTLTAEEFAAKQVDIGIKTNEELLTLQKQRVADLKNQIKERDEINKRFPLFELAPQELDKRKKLDADLVKAETELNRNRITIAKERADRADDLEAKSTKKRQEEIDKQTRQIDQATKNQEIINQQRLLDNQTTDEEITLSQARAAVQRNQKLIQIEQNRIAQINKLESTQDKDILKQRSDAIEKAEDKITDLTLQGIKNQQEIKNATDALVSDQFDTLVKTQESALAQANQIAKEQESIDKQLLQDRLIVREEFEQKALMRTVERVNREIDVEKKKLAELEQVSFLDPEKENDRAKQIIDIRTEISNKTLELIDAEISFNEKVNQRTKKLISERSALITLQIEKQSNAIEQELGKFDRLLKAQDASQKLNESRNNLIQANLTLQESLIEAEKQAFETEISRKEKSRELSKDATAEERKAFRQQEAQDAKRQDFEIQLAKVRKEALLEQQKADAQAKAIELERQEIASRRLVFEQQIAVLKAQQALIDAQQQAQSALIGGNALEIEQAKQKVSFAMQALGINKELLEQAKTEQKLIKETSELDEKAFKKKQKADRVKFRSSTNANLDDDFISTGFDNAETDISKSKRRKRSSRSPEVDFGLGDSFIQKENQRISKLQGNGNLTQESLVAAIDQAFQTEAIMNNLTKIIKANENTAMRVSQAIRNVPPPVSNAASSSLRSTAGLGG